MGSAYGVFTFQIGEPKSVFRIINDVYFAKQRQEPKSESWGSQKFAIGEWEIGFQGMVGINLPFLTHATILPPPPKKNKKCSFYPQLKNYYNN